MQRMAYAVRESFDIRDRQETEPGPPYCRAGVFKKPWHERDDGFTDEKLQEHPYFLWDVKRRWLLSSS